MAPVHGEVVTDPNDASWSAKVIEQVLQQANGPQQRLDWIAYWKAFCVKHGGNPLIYSGRFLFSDGWMYSTTDYSGPEYPPPTDLREFNELLRYYWMRRKRIVENELEALNHAIRGLLLLQTYKSAPLQEVYTFADPETGRLTQKRGPLDMEAMRGRQGWLEADLVQCQEKLNDVRAA